MKKIRVFDISIDYEYRPNDDIYQETVPKELFVEVELPINFNALTLDEQTEVLKWEVIESLADKVLFDTPDDPEFAISDVDFSFEIE